MKPLDKSLIKKLALVLAIKLFLLIGLWWFFVREQRVTLDGNSVATQFLQSAQKPKE